MTEKSYFAPVPNRALVDAGLTGLDLRVLGLIAAHDRFSANGLGCTLSTRRIADKLSATQPKISASLGRLIRAGYVQSSPNPQHAQKRMLAVVYEAKSDATVVARTDARPGISENRTDARPGIHKKLLSKRIKNIPKSARTGVRVVLPNDLLDNEAVGEALRRLQAKGSLSKPEEAWCSALSEGREYGDALGQWALRLLDG